MPPPNILNDGDLALRVSQAVEDATRTDEDTIPLLPAGTLPRSSSDRSSLRNRRSPPPPPWPVEEWLEPEHMRYPLIDPERVLEIVDFHALNYTGDVDDNFLCPICKMPFVTPVTTPCDHTFCFNCLKQGCERNLLCPVDRKRFRAQNIGVASRLLRNQLDSLVVACPNAERGCQATARREDIALHAHRCGYTLARCPDLECPRKVVKWLLEKQLQQDQQECLHVEAPCPHCEEPVEKAVMHEHIIRVCPKNTTMCELCDRPAKKSELKEHVAMECLEAEAACEYAEWGCKHRARRKLLAEHNGTCVYRVCSALGATIKKQEEEIKQLRQENEERDRQLQLLKRRRRSKEGWEAFRLGAGGQKVESPEEAVMGIYEDMERRIEGVRKDMTELEGRQVVMVLNEMMPIKNEITEIRTNMGILKMHVGWLMNRSREELERSRLASRTMAAGGSSGSGGAATSSSSGAGARASSSGAGAGRGRGGSDSEGEGPMLRRPSDGSNGIPRL